MIDAAKYANYPEQYGDLVKRLQKIKTEVGRGQTPVISMALFNQLVPADAMTYCVEMKGAIRDELTQSDFDKFDPVKRRQFTEGGGAIVGEGGDQ